jgi:hypothetical protein
LLGKFLLSEFIKEGAEDFEEIKVKLGEDYWQERVSCDFI